MSQGVPLGFGPKGRYRFPTAVNVVYSKVRDVIELAVALDDGGRSKRLQYSIWPEGEPVYLELAPVEFPAGGSGRAATLKIPSTSIGVQFDLLDASGLPLADLSCLLDIRSGTLEAPPFSGKDYVLKGPLEFGSEGSVSGGKTVTLYGARGEGLRILGDFVIDDGGEALFVQVTDPVSGKFERLLLPRATGTAPCQIELSFVAEPTHGFVDFLDRKGEVLQAMSFGIDFRAGAMRVQDDSSCSATFQNARTGGPPPVCSVGCRVCRGKKALADCAETDRLPAEERDLVLNESLPTWDMGFVCSSCHTRLLEQQREKRRASKAFRYWASIGPSIGLYLAAFFGVMQLLLPHGPWLWSFLRAAFPPLATNHNLLLAITGVCWGFLFTALPLAGLFRAYVQIFFTLPMASAPTMIASLAFQGFLGYHVFFYLQRARVPDFISIPPDVKNPLLWLNFHLYAVTAALMAVFISEFFGQSLRQFADRLVRRGPGIAERVNRIFRRFQKLVGLHHEEEIYEILKAILMEDMGVEEYHILVCSESRDVFRPVVSEGRALSEIQAIQVKRGDANFLGHAAMFGEIYGVHSLNNPELRRVLNKGPMTCQVCAPVKVDGEITALINIARFDEDTYDTDTLAHLSTLTSLLGIALTNRAEHRRKDDQLAVTEANLAREVSAKEELRSAFGKYVPPALIDLLMQNPKEYLEAEPERAELTVLFTDLKGFSTLSEQVGNPSELARILNLYLTDMTDIIFQHWGTLDKYVGDAIVAFFGWPVGYYSDHARRACAAAMQMRDHMEDLAREIGYPDLRARIGINTGEMVVGNFGSKVRKSLTVLGDNVNLGARLEPTNKEYGTDVLIASETYSQVRDSILAREIDRVRVVGRSTPVTLYEPIAEKSSTLPGEISGFLDGYAEGLRLYRSRQFLEAISAFDRSLQMIPEDGPSQTMRIRATHFAETPPPPDWDGVHSVTVK